MHGAAHAGVVIGFFFGGWEILLILAITLILIGAKKLPELAKGLGDGICQFRDATRDVADELDEEARKAGRSLGGIYGKPAAQAISSDNQVAEFYEADSEKDSAPRSKFFLLKKRLIELWKAFWAWVSRTSGK